MSKTTISLVLLLATACAGAGEKRAAPEEGRSEAKVEGPWNGGKQTAPIELSSSLSGEVQTEAEQTVVLSLTPRRDCQQLTSVVRGLDGVQVETSARSHGACVAGQAVQHEARVKVPSGVAGHLVVDVSMEVEGRHLAVSRAVELRAPGAVARKGASTVTRDANGNPVVVMPAEER
jgi:hypothetical protein